jgi:hypothetical protein
MSVTTAIQNATRAIGSMLSSSPSETEILDTLKKEHEEVAEMLKKLVDSESGAARKNLVAKIKAALLPHVEAEQTVLYDALIKVGDKKIQQDGKEGYIEHELAAATLARLEKIPNAMSAEFGATAKVLKELIEHHVQEEERNVWADAKEKFSADERVAMNRKYLAAKKFVSGLETKAVAASKTAAAAAPKKPTVQAAKKITVAAAPKTVAAPASKKAALPKQAAAPKKTAAPKKPAAVAKPKKPAAIAAKKVAVTAKQSPATSPAN